MKGQFKGDIKKEAWEVSKEQEEVENNEFRTISKSRLAQISKGGNKWNKTISHH